MSDVYEFRKQYLDRVTDFVLMRFKFVSEPVAQYIACLSGLESFFGTSQLAFDCNNFTGMKLPKFRLSTALGERRGHAYYSSFECCIVDLFYYFQYAGLNQSHFKDLALFVRKFKTTKYNPNPDYYGRIMSLKTQYYG